ncbi:MAG: hypothetical protein ACOY94_26340 [Bacillota bacterium]
MGKKTQSQKKTNSQAIWVVAGVAVAAAAVLIAISLTRPGKDATPLAANPNPAPGVKSDKELGAVRNVKGSPDAKVTLSEWNDYL